MASNRYITMPAIIQFEGIEIRIVDRQGRPWIALTDLTRALYGLEITDTSVGSLRAPLRAVGRIFAKNAVEFTENMTAILALETNRRGPKEVRIFSPRGCYLMGMLAKTDRAQRFRRWVLDVLEGKIAMPNDERSVIERRLRVNETNAATRALEAIRRASGSRTAALAAPGIYGNYIDDFLDA